eukprot:TRINITY_DN1018_c0_g1_i3.p1 TRINITY_DN1018_c0_g1~~TRINITY_DN1018_c0_g1_i3.p1  ORF type:complete len:500 (+),score=175.66 TRINITY_DN1018_c0_g1_i3:57-1556(+)
MEKEPETEFAKLAKPKKERKKHDKPQNQSVLVRGLPAETTQAMLEEHFGTIGPLRRCIVITNKGESKCNGLGFVYFALESDAVKATKMTLPFHGSKLTVKLSTKDSKDTKKPRTAPSDQKAEPSIPSKPAAPTKMPSKKIPPKTVSVIVRNLPFDTTVQDLLKVFPPGQVQSAQIPRNPSTNKNKGFGFVHFNKPEHAEQAIASGNFKIKRRSIVIDWADHDHKAKLEQAENQVEEEDVEMDKEDEDEDMDKEEDDDDDDDEDDEDSQVENQVENEDEKEEEAKDEKDKDSDNEEEVGAKDHQDRIVFVRNLNVESTRSDLFNLFKKYGRIDKIFLVKDSVTNMCKGSAFVHFEDESGASAAIAAAYKYLGGDEVENGSNSVESEISLKDRNLILGRSLTKNQAQAKVSKVGMKQKDKRNLYLAEEGNILKGSDAAEGVSDSDLQKRDRARSEKRVKLKNPNFYVSRNRLSVRNFPPTYTDAQLKKIISRSCRRSERSC